MDLEGWFILETSILTHVDPILRVFAFISGKLDLKKNDFLRLISGHPHCTKCLK